MCGLAMGVVEQIRRGTTIGCSFPSEPRGMPMLGQVLDHVGFVGPDLQAMRAEWQRLGFQPTLPQALRAVDSTGEVADLGQRSCHVMLEHGYVELTEVRSDAKDHHLAPWLARGPGLCIVAYGVPDAEAWRADCGEPTMSAVMTATRDIDYGVPGSLRGAARFRWCMRDPALTPMALECVVEHCSPELVFQPAVQRHPNAVCALRGLQVRDGRIAVVEFLTRDLDALRACLAGAGVAREETVQTAVDGPPQTVIETPLATATGCRLRFFAVPA